jgi:hypothetical protein
LRIRFHRWVWLASTLMFADGGAVQFRKPAGPLSITVFSAPVPLRVGSADLSVLVQTNADANAVLNAAVLLQLSKSGEQPINVPATRAQATNKLLYAAHPVLSSAGAWHLNVQVTWNGDTLNAPGEITVLPRETSLSSFWPYFALVPAGVLLFLANQWLKRRRQRLFHEEAVRPQPRRQNRAE